MLESFILILLLGFFAGQIAQKFKIPALVGMILAGIILGSQVTNLISADVLSASPALRVVAVMVILMKAGLGLDREKLLEQGTVALRLGFLPGICEALIICFSAMWIFKFDFPTGLLLGCIIGAESPAVIVPGMLRLKSLGWGVSKGIPDAILIGSALSDVLLLLVFSLLLSFFAQTTSEVILPFGLTLSAIQILPIQIILQIVSGLLLGFLSAKVLVFLLVKQKWTNNIVQSTLVSASGSLLLVVMAEKFPFFSGYLAVMSMGFFLIEFDSPLARQLRSGFDSLWNVAQIVLFVLLGASIQLQVLESTLFSGLLILAIGTLIGRSLGWYLSTLGSNWNGREKLFLLPANSAKATVQAAIGAIPLTQGIVGGEIILAIAALSILVTAPLGAWAIPTFAPKLLSRGEVDPTKVAIARSITLLAVVDSSGNAKCILNKTAELARRSDGEVIVLCALCAIAACETEEIDKIQQIASKSLADIRYKFISASNSVSIDGLTEEIIRICQECKINEIITGKAIRDNQSDKPWENANLSPLSQSLLKSSSIPIVFVEVENL